jgi:O-antigen/teichoic acid export membrane protein
LKAVGRGGLLVRLSLISVALLVPAALAGVAWLGLIGVALAWIVVDSARFALSLRALRREIEVDPHQLFEALRPPLVAGIAMFICVWLIGSLLGEPGLLVLVAQGMVGVVSYVAALYILNPAVVADLSMLRILLRRAPAD